MAILKILYAYYCFFLLPNTFLTYTNIYDLQVKLKIIEAIGTVFLEKVFYVKVFLEQFNLSTSKKARIKKHIVKIFNQLQMVGNIKNHYRLIKRLKQI